MAQISDNELRKRLERHDYNVPPITDTTRKILFKKLNQLDEASRGSRRRYSRLDYSSAEEEDLPAPLASSTMTGEEDVSEEDYWSEEEEEVERADLAIQTSLTSNSSSNSNSSSSSSSLPSPTHNNNSSALPLVSPDLRKSIQHSENGSLDEAMKALPASSKEKMKQSGNNSVTSQASPSSYKQSYNKERKGVCFSMTVTFLMIVLFLLMLFHCLSLEPPQAVPALAACAGLNCVPPSELNHTVHLAKQIYHSLPTNVCGDADLVAESRVRELLKEKYPESMLDSHLANLLVLLRQNHCWGIRVEEIEGEIYLRKMCHCWTILWTILRTILRIIIHALLQTTAYLIHQISLIV